MEKAWSRMGYSLDKDWLVYNYTASNGGFDSAYKKHELSVIK